MIDPVRNRAIGELQLASLEAGHLIRIRVQGTSMLPSLWPGDVLTVLPLTSAMPAPGDIALTCNAGRILAHRVIDRRVQDGAVTLITRGDALTDTDPVAATVLGTVTERNGRPLDLLARRPTRLLSLILRLGDRWRPLLALALKLRALRVGFWPASI